MMPIQTGTANAQIPANARTAFLAKFNLATMRFAIITSIRFWRFAAVTPDTHTSGDSA